MRSKRLLLLLVLAAGTTFVGIEVRATHAGAGDPGPSRPVAIHARGALAGQEFSPEHDRGRAKGVGDRGGRGDLFQGGGAGCDTASRGWSSTGRTAGRWRPGAGKGTFFCRAGTWNGRFWTVRWTSPSRARDFGPKGSSTIKQMTVSFVPAGSGPSWTALEFEGDSMTYWLTDETLEVLGAVRTTIQGRLNEEQGESR